MAKAVHQKLLGSHGSLHVLSVGVSDYAADSGFSKLKVCTEDARRVAQTFREVRELNADPAHIRLLGNLKDAYQMPTGGYIHAALHVLAESAAKHDRILFFFSGHGVRVDDALYLVPQDGNSEHKKFLISFEDVITILNKSDAKQKLIVLDSCLSGPSVSKFKSPLSSASSKFLADYLAKTEGTAVIGSSTADQPSTTLSPDPKVSLFTHFFVTALRGNAEAMDGKLLTLDSLFNYVSVNVIKHSKSYGKTQQPTMQSGGTGVMVLGDFSHPLVSATASDLAPAVDKLKFHDHRPGHAKDVLTALTNTWRHQPDYIEGRVNDLIPDAYKEEFGRLRAKLFKFFDAGQIKIRDNSVFFPGGRYSVRYKADDVKNGTYVYTARFDSDWLTRPDQMLDLIKLMNVTPDAIEFDSSDALVPEECLPKLQAAGWTITNAQDDEVEAERDGYSIKINSNCIELSGFTPRELFGKDSELDSSALLVTGLIKQLAGK